MTYSDSGKRDTLYYRLLSKSSEAPGLWGHEYVRHLAAELGDEYIIIVVPSGSELSPISAEAGVAADDPALKEPVRAPHTVEQLRALGLELVAFFLKHNAEADAVDLLLELECIGEMEGAVDDKTYPRVCQYMFG